MRRSRKLLALAATVLTAVTTLLGPASPAAAAPANSYMLVNDSYPSMCLSRNNSEPAGLDGVVMVYLATCNKATPQQWWWLPSIGNPSHVENTVEWDSDWWCLSTNFNQPVGGGAGTHNAYAARCNAQTSTQNWENDSSPGPYKLRLRSAVANDGMRWCLSATSSNPYSGGTYRVYTAACSTAAAQVWRPWQP